MHPFLVLDLSKARKHGSVNKEHDYLLRYADPVTGKWKYVRPDDSDGEFLPSGQFQLSPGVTIAAIIQRKLYGGPTGQKVKETGAPIYKDGRFATHVVVGKGQYEQALYRAKQEKRPDPYLRNAIDVKTVGNYHVFTYPHAVAVEWDKDGKPTRWGGFSKPDLHTSVTHTHGYELPPHLAQFEIKTADQHATVIAHATTIPEGPAKASSLHPIDPTTGMIEHGHEFAPQTGANKITPQQIYPHLPLLVSAEESYAGEGSLVGGVADPISLAKKLIERLEQGKKAPPTEGGHATHIESFPSWALDKFSSEQELKDELERRPLTTLITLGQFKLSPGTPKLNQMLLDEWYGKIRGMAGLSGMDLLKYTAEYEKRHAQDAVTGKHHGPESALRSYRLQKTNELAQAAIVKFMVAAQGKYTPKLDNPTDRFDKFIARVIHNAIKDASRAEAGKGETSMDDLHEGEIDAAARIAGGRAEPLAADEGADLHRVTPLARLTLHSILQGLPETYRRVLNARLWLTEDALTEDVAPAVASAEAAQIKDHHAHLETGLEADRLAGKIPNLRRRDSEGWRRDYTGPAGISSLHADWTDPETGKPVNLAALSNSQQTRKLQGWFDAGITHVFKKLSVSGSFGKLTPEGAAVRRYLELEAKLASASRRGWSAEKLKTVALPAPGGLTTPMKLIPPSAHPAVDFFSQSPNQKLAERLGITTPGAKLSTSLGSGSIANVSMGSKHERVLKLAEGYHARIKSLQESTSSELTAAAAAAKHSVAMTDPDVWDKIHAAANAAVHASTQHGAFSSEAVTALAHYKKLHTGAVLHAPEAAQFYDASVAFGTPVAGVQHSRVKATVARSRSVAQNTLALVDFVRGVSKALKAIRVHRHDTVDALRKAFYDYEFELSRLDARRAA